MIRTEEARERKGNAHCIGNVDIRRRNLFALSIRFLNFRHVPDTESGPTELSPDFYPAIILGWLVAIGLALDATD